MKLLWLLPLLLVGCADSGTRGDNSEREYREVVVINDNSGTIELMVDLTASSDTDTETTQDTRNQATVSPRTSAALYGGTAQLAEQGAETFMKGVTSLYQQWQDNKKLIEQPTSPDVSVQESSEVNTEQIELKPLDNKSFAWLKHNGGHYGKMGTFTLSDGCGSFTVPDMDTSHGADGDSSNHSQLFYFSGNDFQPGEDEYNNGLASVFTAPGCVSKTAILTYGE